MNFYKKLIIGAGIIGSLVSYNCGKDTPKTETPISEYPYTLANHKTLPDSNLNKLAILALKEIETQKKLLEIFTLPDSIRKQINKLEKISGLNR